MWCPKCKNEYVDGITKCADCGCDLVLSLSNGRDFSSEASAEEMSDDANILEDRDDFSEAVEEEPDVLSGPAHVYISIDTKIEDLKSTAYTFLAVGALGLLFVVLFFFGVLPIQVSSYMRIMITIVMGIMFLIFLGIGINSFKQYQKMRVHAGSEETLEVEIKTWFSALYTADFLNNGIDASLSKEQKYFARYQKMTQLISDKYPDVDDSFLDHIIEQLYLDIFNE